ncbi:MAG: hypothetical protein OXB93_00935 [Cytophagales bacterium]|nr:hypothetical protein [Cytophagales bacterium]
MDERNTWDDVILKVLKEEGVRGVRKSLYAKEVADLIIRKGLATEDNRGAISSAVWALAIKKGVLHYYNEPGKVKGTTYYLSQSTTPAAPQKKKFGDHRTPKAKERK